LCREGRDLKKRELNIATEKHNQEADHFIDRCMASFHTPK
jgi:hypothetical protein